MKNRIVWSCLFVAYSAVRSLQWLLLISETLQQLQQSQHIMKKHMYTVSKVLSHIIYYKEKLAYKKLPKQTAEQLTT